MALSAPNIPGIVMTLSGVEVSQIPSEEHLKLAIDAAMKAERAFRFVIGDLINIAESEYGTKYDDWQDQTGLSYDRLRAFAYVCRAIPLEERHPALGIDHHLRVAKLEKGEREKWLRLAEKHSMGEKRLGKSIELGEVASLKDMGPPPETDSSYGSINPHVNRLSSYLSRLEREGELDAMEARGLLVLFEDLSPVIAHAAGIAIRIEDTGDMTVIKGRDLVAEHTGIVAALIPSGGIIEAEVEEIYES